jgi:putative ABC transport system substrate-binding protein
MTCPAEFFWPQIAFAAASPSSLARPRRDPRMRRRELIALLASGAMSWPITATAQQPAMPAVGFLHPASLAGRERLVAMFREGLAERGYTEGRNVTIEYRWAEGHYDRLPALANDLVSWQVAVIAAATLPSAVAAKQATSTIPIVFWVGDDPIKHGLAASLSHPGGNATGITMFSAGLIAKRLGLLRELVPKASQIAILVNPNNPNLSTQSGEVGEAARSLGEQFEILRAGTEREIDAAFASLADRGVGGLVVGADPVFVTQGARIVALAARYRVPAIYERREFVDAGGLVSYGTDQIGSFRQIGRYTGRILEGIKPADLPVMQPTTFELVINLKTANALGAIVPPILLAQADEVIE